MEELFPELRCTAGIFGMLMESMAEKDYFQGVRSKSSKLVRIRDGGDPLWDGHLFETLKQAGIFRDFCYSHMDGSLLQHELQAHQIEASFGQRLAEGYGILDPAEIADLIRGVTLMLQLCEFLTVSEGDFWALGVYGRDLP